MNFREKIAQIAGSMPIESFIPKTGVKIATTEEEAQEFQRASGAQGDIKIFILRRNPKISTQFIVLTKKKM